MVIHVRVLQRGNAARKTEAGRQSSHPGAFYPILKFRAVSSVGRAPRSQRGGRGFESLTVHQKMSPRRGLIFFHGIRRMGMVRGFQGEGANCLAAGRRKTGKGPRPGTVARLETQRPLRREASRRSRFESLTVHQKKEAPGRGLFFSMGFEGWGWSVVFKAKAPTAWRRAVVKPGRGPVPGTVGRLETQRPLRREASRRSRFESLTVIKRALQGSFYIWERSQKKWWA